MKFPKISIITPSFNQGQFLEETIQSVLNQNYPNLEYIIIDGGSTDNSIEVIKKYQDQLSYWVSEPDKGTWEADNKGIARMTGDYWCILNSDDLFTSDALHQVARYVYEFPSLKWITGGEIIIDENGEILNKRTPVIPAPISGLTFLNGCYIPHHCTFLHKSVVEMVGYFENWNVMDYNYWLRMEYHGLTPAIINNYLGKFRVHDGSKTQKIVDLRKEILTMVKDFVSKNKLISGEIKKRLNETKLNISKLELDNLEDVDSLKLYLRLLFDNPHLVKTRVYHKKLWKAIFS